MGLAGRESFLGKGGLDLGLERGGLDPGWGGVWGHHSWCK